MRHNLTVEEISAFCVALFDGSGSDDSWLATARKDPLSALAVLGMNADIAAHPFNPADAEKTNALLWRWSYRLLPDNDAHAVMLTIVFMEKYGLWQMPNGARYGFQDLPSDDKLDVFWGPRWVDGACTTINVGHKLLAALAVTDIAAESYADIKLPWPAFSVNVPSGALPLHESYEVRRIRFLHMRAATVMGADTDHRGMFYGDPAAHGGLHDIAHILVETTEGTKLHVNRNGDNALRRLLFEDDRRPPRVVKEELLEPLDSEEERLMLAVRRILVGLIYTVQHTTNWKERTRTSKRTPKQRNGPPDHRDIVLTAPIKFDVRQGLFDWLRHGNGKHSPPSVQLLVKGHYKRQAHGPGRSERKVIWIEPYWRGPEDAPIRNRSYTKE